MFFLFFELSLSLEALIPVPAKVKLFAPSIDLQKFRKINNHNYLNFFTQLFGFTLLITSSPVYSAYGKANGFSRLV
jgi:hypothetical protein